MATLKTPATPRDYYLRAVLPAAQQLPMHMANEKAFVLQVAIAVQESDLETRVQRVYRRNPDTGARELLRGPARGFPQFEIGHPTRGGGVWGVFNHGASHRHLGEFCRARGVEFAPRAIWAAMEFDDILGAGLSRLLLWTDRRALPEFGDEAGGWGYYVRNWNPGQPKPEKWPFAYSAALAALRPEEDPRHA